MNMNQRNKTLFESLMDDLQTYQHDVDMVLDTFAKERDTARKYADQYKDAEKIFADKMKEYIPKIRRQLMTANADLSEKLLDLHKQLSEQLFDALCKPQETAFLRLLSAYEEHGLKPSRTEIDVLTTLNGGNFVGFRLINNLLSLVESPFRIKSHEIEEFEKSLEDLHKLAEEVELTPMFGLNNLTEGKQVFGRYGNKSTVEENTIVTTCISEPAPKYVKLEDGSIASVGQTWGDNDTDLTICATLFENLPERINNISTLWTSIETYPEITKDEMGEAIQIAKEYGQQTAEAGAVANKLVEAGLVK